MNEEENVNTAQTDDNDERLQEANDVMEQEAEDTGVFMPDEDQQIGLSGMQPRDYYQSHEEDFPEQKPVAGQIESKMANDPALNGRTSNGVVRTDGGDLRTGQYVTQKDYEIGEAQWKAQKAAQDAQRQANRMRSQAVQAQAQALLDSGDWYDTGRGYLRQKKFNKGFKRDGSGDRGVVGNRRVWRPEYANVDGQQVLDNAWQGAAGNVASRNRASAQTMTKNMLDANRLAFQQQDQQLQRRRKRNAECNLGIFDGMVSALDNLMSSEVSGDRRGVIGNDNLTKYRVGYVAPSLINAINGKMGQKGVNDYRILGLSAQWKLDANGNKVGEPMFHARYRTADGKVQGRVMTMQQVYDLGRDNYNIMYQKDANDQSQIGDANYHAINALDQVLGKYDESVRGGLNADMRGYRRGDIERQKKEADLKYTQQKTQFASQDQAAKFYEDQLSRIGDMNNKLISAAQKIEDVNPDRAQALWYQVRLNQERMRRTEKEIQKIRIGGESGKVGTQAAADKNGKQQPQNPKPRQGSQRNLTKSQIDISDVTDPTGVMRQIPVEQNQRGGKRLIRPPAGNVSSEESKSKAKELREKNGKKSSASMQSNKTEGSAASDNQERETTKEQMELLKDKDAYAKGRWDKIRKAVRRNFGAPGIED